MATKIPSSQFQRSSASDPKAGLATRPKSARLRGFSALPHGKRFPPHFPPQPGPILREPGASWLPPGAEIASPGGALGMPLSIREVAYLIGCSPWTVRQTLIARGLPHFRFTANGRLIFYRDQVIRWIENQQQGGNNK
jgi:hypothetical protein